MGQIPPKFSAMQSPQVTHRPSTIFRAASSREASSTTPIERFAAEVDDTHETHRMPVPYFQSAYKNTNLLSFLFVNIYF
jgi:hypothetical protein